MQKVVFSVVEKILVTREFIQYLLVNTAGIARLFAT